jgi:hypothetical protein
MIAVANGVRERPILFSGEMVRAILDGRKTQTRRVITPKPPVETGDLVNIGGNCWACIGNNGPNRTCPYEPGHRLWVRETWQAEFEWPAQPGDHLLNYWHEVPPGFRGVKNAMRAYYRADWAEYYVNKYDDKGSDFSLSFNTCVDESQLVEYDFDEPLPFRWVPSIHMPRWASRITLEVTAVRGEQVQDISEDDAIDEGLEPIVNDPITDGYGEWQKPYVISARDQYVELWNSLNAKRGYGWDVNPWVWVVEFRRVEDR